MFGHTRILLPWLPCLSRASCLFISPIRSIQQLLSIFFQSPINSFFHKLTTCSGRLLSRDLMLYFLDQISCLIFLQFKVLQLSTHIASHFPMKKRWPFFFLELPLCQCRSSYRKFCWHYIYSTKKHQWRSVNPQLHRLLRY